ncbi:MAG: sensor histidine kinase [Parvularculaceae bacterium]
MGDGGDDAFAAKRAGDAARASPKADGEARRKRRKRFVVSRLTLTIVITNLSGLMILFVGSFAVTAYRESLIEAKLEGVRAQAQIVADVLAQIAVDAEGCALVEQPVIPGADVDPGPPIDVCRRAMREEDVREVFRRVWDSFEGRIRVFRAPPVDFEGGGLEIENADRLLIEDVVLRQDEIRTKELGPLDAPTPNSAWWRLNDLTQRGLGTFMTGAYRRAASVRTVEQEIARAANSSPTAEMRGWAWVRFDENGELVASVSIPIRKVQAVYGVVTSEIGGIDELVAKARLAILPFFGLAIAAAILSSLLLTAAIAQPIRQLAIAADKVREGITAAARARIPDFAYRRDEIGELSASLKAMTRAIYERIEAIESFAADVSHELKNPLTSIRSATETLEIATKPEARDKLMAVIKKDVERMDRLITDISNASRLDADLAREAREVVDLRKLLIDIVELYRATARDGETRVAFDPSGTPVYLFGNATALGQVFRNLIDNARSFSPAGATVRVSLERAVAPENVARIYVDDEGPGVPPDALEKIFDRFYTKRPKGASFGNNSGLGLAICRQIAQSHGGAVWAENRLGRPGADADVEGARFAVELPLIQ